MNEIAKMVVQMRQQAHLTQQELAEKAGTTQPVIARLESDSYSRIPNLGLTKLAFAADAKIKIAIKLSLILSWRLYSILKDMHYYH